MSTAYFQKFNAASPSQHGVCNTLSINKAAHRATTSGQDTDGLGRWPGLFTEVVTTSLRVVTAYRPVRNTAMSVWNQQRSYFDGKMTIVALGTLQYSLGRRHSTWLAGDH
jgi:hypothetical protein